MSELVQVRRSPSRAGLAQLHYLITLCWPSGSYDCAHKLGVELTAGTGAAVARRFAKEGFKTALLSRKLANLSPVEKEIQEAGGKAISVPCDCGAADRYSPDCHLAFI